METTETQILTPAPKINLENVSLKKFNPICKGHLTISTLKIFVNFLTKKKIL